MPKSRYNISRAYNQSRNLFTILFKDRNNFYATECVAIISCAPSIELNFVPNIDTIESKIVTIINCDKKKKKVTLDNI